MNWNNLYNKFKYERTKLPDFLKDNCDYNYLKNLFVEIENNKQNSYHQNNTCIIRNLFLGKCGLESNKQKAIYELPTNQLLIIIQFICQFIKINYIEELAAGQGLLSHMLKFKLGNDFVVNASDGIRSMETSNKNKFYDIENKMFLNYCLDNNFDFKDKLLIISWMPFYDFNDFKYLLNKKTPNNIIIIGDNHKLIIDNLKILNYKYCIIHAKQLCFKDYFKNNIFSTNSKSSILFATNDNNIDIKSLLLNLKLKFNDCLFNNTQKINDKIIIQDNINKIGIEFILDKINDNIELKKIVDILFHIYLKKIKIPNYLKKYNDLLFWFQRAKNNKFPKNIHNINKFKEYKKYILKLNSENGLEYLKNFGIISNWVSNKTMAEKFIFLDFSLSNKKWKLSFHEFENQFNDMSFQNNMNFIPDIITLS